MNGCTDIRDLFAAVLENEASRAEIDQVRAHIDGCAECAELYDAMGMIIGAGDFLARMWNRRHTSVRRLASSPCRRWLGLLYQAVDREISQPNLERLLTHLEVMPFVPQGVARPHPHPSGRRRHDAAELSVGEVHQGP